MNASLFSTLKPLCLEMMQHRQWSHSKGTSSSSVLKQFADVVRDLDDRSLTSVIHLLFPPILQILTDAPAIEKLHVENALVCLEVLLERCTEAFPSQLVLQQIFMILLNTLAHQTKNATELIWNSEIVRLGISNLRLTVNVTNVRYPTLFKSNRFRLPSAHAIALLSDTFLLSTILEIRIVALDCCRALFVHLRDPDVLANYLPGVVSSLTKMLTSKQTLSRKLISSGFETLDVIVTLTCCDQSSCTILRNEPDKLMDLVSMNVNCVNTGLYRIKDETTGAPSLIRNEAWLVSVRQEMYKVIDRLSHIRSHPEQSVRKNVAIAFSNILLRCHQALSKSCAPLVESLMILAEDEEKIVAEIAQKTISRIDSSNEFQHLKRLLLIRFDSILSETLDSFSSVDDTKKLSHLMVVNAFLNMFGSDVQSCICGRLSEIVEKCRFILSPYSKNPKPDNRSVSLQLNLSPEDRLKMAVASKTEYQYFADNRVERALFNFCHLLCLQCSAADLIGEVLDVPNGFANNIPALRLLNASLSSNQQISKGLNDLFYGITLELMEGKYMILPTDNCDDSTLQAAGAVTSLQLIQKLSVILGKEFNPMLFKMLYVVLDKCGDPNEQVALAGRTTLAVLAESCGFSDISMLIVNNRDFIVHEVSRRLLEIERFPSAPVILSGLVNICGPETIILIQDIIERLPETLAYVTYSSNYVAFRSLLSCLRTIIHVISQHITNTGNTLPWEKAKQNEYDDEMDHSLNEKNLLAKCSLHIQRLYLRHRTMGFENDAERSERKEHTYDELSEAFISKTHSNQVDQPSVSLPSEKEAIPAELLPFVNVALRTVEMLINYVASEDSRISAEIMRTLAVASQSIIWRRPELIALLHDIWPSLLARLSDEQIYVRIAALDLVQACSETLKDFFPRQFVQELFSRIRALILQNQDQREVKASLKTLSSLAQYSFTHKNAAQVAIDFLNLRYDRIYHVEANLLFENLELSHGDVVAFAAK